MDSRLIVAVGTVGVVVLYAVMSGYWTSRSPGWYTSLPSPSWQPPDIVFGIIWPLNFLVLGVASWMMGYTQPRVSAITFGVTLTGSVVFALSWAYLFYVPHRLGMAAASLTMATVLTWALFAVAFDTQPWIGYLLVPYAGWMTIATTLAFGYARLVPAAQRRKSLQKRR